jgi:Tol biopolymer transport system component
VRSNLLPLAWRTSLAATLVLSLVACGLAWPAASEPVASGPSATAVVVAPSATPAASPSPATPVVHHGESWIVYQWAPHRGPGLYLVRADGSDAHEIAIGLPGEAALPDWSPDGKQIVFELMVSENIFEIWTVDANGSNPRKVYGCEAAPCVQVGVPAWSPDGRQLAFARLTNPSGDYHDDHLTIEVLDLQTGQAKVIASAPATESQAVEYVKPRWSPEGTEVVFVINRYALPPTNESVVGSSVAIVRADGSDKDAPRLLTKPEMFASGPDWGADGKWIVFNTHGLGFAADERHAANLYRIRPNGTGLVQLTSFEDGDPHRANQPSWSPDGLRILFTYNGHTDFSADDQHLAFVDDDGSDMVIYRGVPGTHFRLRPIP